MIIFPDIHHWIRVCNSRRQVEDWRPWFAWHPVWIDGKGMVWLERVTRKWYGRDKGGYLYA